MEPTKMRLRTRKKVSAGKACQAMTAEASPDSKCPICLDRFNNMAYLDRCLHKFCFRCIHEWSKNKAECPLCKQGFNSIFHTIKAENDFKEFVLRPVENGSFASPEGRRFRYRTTLTSGRRNARQITHTPPDSGVIFEGLAAAVPSQPDREVRRMMTRMAARRRAAQGEGQTLREQEAVRFRRALYRTGVRVRSVRDGGRYRDTSSEFYRSNPACLHRLLPWLKRELVVLYGAHGSLVNIVQHIIMSWITRYDMEDEAMKVELRPFLLARTDHFLHEFISFARSPFNMEAYDQHAVYDCPAPSSLEDSGSDASVIAISEDEDEDVLDLRRAPAPDGALSQAPWDDETPGPSYSTTEQATPVPLAVSESESESGSEERVLLGSSPQQDAQVTADPAAGKDGTDSSSEEDCVIIGYVKPMVERTPELVQLSSDSEESVQNESVAEAFPQPQHIRFPSQSPPSSTASAGSKPPKQGQAQSCERLEAKDGDRTTDRRRSSSPWGSPPPDRCRTSRDKVRKSGKHHRKDRSDRDKRRRKRDGSRRRRWESGSGEGTRRRSKSPAISIRSDSTLSRGVGRSRSRSRDRRRSRDGTREGRREEHSCSRWRDCRSDCARERDAGYASHSQTRSHHIGDRSDRDRWRPSGSRSRTPPTGPRRRDRRRSRSPSTASSRGSRSARRRSRHDKPGGKRKYKTRHLEDSSRDQSSPGQRAAFSPSPSCRAVEKIRRRRRSHGKSRSSSVEIVYEGRSTGDGRKRHKKRKKHKKKSRRKRAREPGGCGSPSVITIHSDSDLAGPEPAPLHLRCPESSDDASGNPGNTRLLESLLQTWEGPTRAASPGSSADTLKAAEAFISDDAKHDVPVGNSDRTPTSPKDETSTSSTSKISTESSLPSCL